MVRSRRSAVAPTSHPADALAGGPADGRGFNLSESLRRFAVYGLTLGVIAAAYFGAAKLGLGLASINPSASPIWPATGLALAAVLLGGYRVWPAIFIGAMLANATTAGS